MTNYNERLNKIIHQLAKDIDFEQYRFSKGSVNSEFHNYAMEKYEDEAKQAITSLTKELVAESKPKNNWLEGSDLFHGQDEGVGEFEQNLLKALEEV